MAGWGSVSNANCITTAEGMERSKLCASHCSIMTSTPSADDERCITLRNHLGSVKYDKHAKEAPFVVKQGNNQSLCYRFNDINGWCSTEESDDNSNNHWGYCSDTRACKYADDSAILSQKLQETKVKLLSNKICNKFLSKGEYKEGLEICAGHKVNYGKTRVYDIVKRANNKTIITRKKSMLDVRSKEDFKRGGARYKYYIGKSDSCTGDSGGPLFRTERGKHILIGVVSRGTECALFNKPGIYTDVERFKTWIFNITRICRKIRAKAKKKNKGKSVTKKVLRKKRMLNKKAKSKKRMVTKKRGYKNAKSKKKMTKKAKKKITKKVKKKMTKKAKTKGKKKMTKKGKKRMTKKAKKSKRKKGKAKKRKKKRKAKKRKKKRKKRKKKKLRKRKRRKKKKKRLNK